VVQEQAEPAAGGQDPGDLMDRGLEGVQVLEGEADHHCVEAAPGEREGLGGGPAVADVSAPGRSGDELPHGGVDADGPRAEGSHPS